MAFPGASAPPEPRQRRRHEQSLDLAAAAISVASVFGNADLLAEILLRLNSPAWLVRAALASRSFLRAASARGFLDRFRALHPPRVLGLSVRGMHSPTRLLPVPQPAELAAATRIAGGAIGALGRDDRLSDYCNGRVLVEMLDAWGRPLRYAVGCVLHTAPHRILPPPPKLFSASEEPGLCNTLRMFLLGDDGGDVTSCLFLSMACDPAKVRVYFSILLSGAWGAPQSAVRELHQDPYLTVLGHKILSGGNLYMMTTAGCILVLDLATASFFTIELPDGAEHSASLKFSRAQHFGLYLICATGFQLHVWHGDGLGQWVLVDTISVCDACAQLHVQKWVPEDENSSPVLISGVGDNAEFVILELVASGIVCCMQLSNRVVEKVAEGLLQIYVASIRPITMAWPPVLPVLD